MTAVAEPMPRKGFHPIRAVKNRVKTLALSLTGGHVFGAAFIGLYYVLFEIVHPVKFAWDTLLSEHVRVLSQAHWDTWRHLFRGGGESYLAGLALQQFIYNPYKHKVKQIHGAWEIVLRFLLSLAAAIPVFIVGGLLVGHAQHWLHTGTLAPAISSHPSLEVKLYADQWTTKVVAFLAAIVGARRPMMPIFDYNLRFFAERRVARGKRIRWFHTAAYQQLVYDAQREHGAEVAAHQQAARGAWVSRLLVGGSVVTLMLAVWGTYVLNHFA